MTVQQQNILIYQGSLLTGFIPAPTGIADVSAWGARMQFRSAPANQNGALSLSLTTGGGGLVASGAGWTYTITPTQSASMTLLSGVQDFYGDPDGSPDNATVICEFGTWSMRPAVTVGTPAGPFTPLSLGGVGLWVRADLGVTLLSGKVSKWADQSGAGNDLTASGSNQPTFTALDAKISGPALTFAGGQKMNTAAITVPQPVTIFAIGYASSLAGNPGLFDDAVTRLIGYISSGAPNWAMDGGGLVSGGTPDTSLHAFCFVFNHTTSSIYVDSALAPVISGNAGNNQGTGGFIIGTQATGFWNGAFAEFAIINRALQQSEIAQLFAYAQQSRPAASFPSTLADDGNSITFGDFAFPRIQDCYAGLVASRFPGVNYVNNGVEGESTPQMDTNAAINTDPQYSALRPHNVVIANEVVNDYNTNGNSTALCISHMATYVANRHAVGWKVVVCTCLPNYIMSEVDRATINNAFLAGATGADAIADIGNTSTIMGNHANITNVAYYADQLHPTSLGHSLIEPVITAVVRPLMA